MYTAPIRRYYKAECLYRMVVISWCNKTKQLSIVVSESAEQDGGDAVPVSGVEYCSGGIRARRS